MFGVSFVELLVLLILAIIFVRPKDLPDIVKFFAKIIFHGKRVFNDAKQSLKNLSKELGVDDLKQELDENIALEKIRNSDDTTIIVDMEGNEHKVPNIKNIRPDLTEEEINDEIKTLNQNNKKASTEEKI